ncbi:inosine 5'-monophosphate dehydrogenase [compost metagenome]
MSRQPITISPDSSLPEAAAIMLEQHVSCLPVLENGALVGIVSWKDLLRVMRDWQPV